jgi:hypothetical protein
MTSTFLLQTHALPMHEPEPHLTPHPPQLLASAAVLSSQPLPGSLSQLE